MEVGTMSVNEGYGQDYGELFECDETPKIFGGVGGPRSNIQSNGPSSRAVVTEPLSSSQCPAEISMDLNDLRGPKSSAHNNAPSSRAVATERLSSSRYPSEISMDLNDLRGPKSSAHNNAPSSRAVATERLSSSRCPSEISMDLNDLYGSRSSTHINGPPSRAVATERLSSSRCPSEISMDLSDLQDALPEEDSNDRFVSGSMQSACSDRYADGFASPLHQQLVSVEEDCSWKSDDDDGDAFSNYGNNADDVNNSDLLLDQIPDFFQENGTSDFSSFYNDLQDGQQKHSKIVDEQGETDSTSLSTSSLVTSQESSSRNFFHSSNGSLNSRRKVKFEISSRLEDIQEFEKPDIEDYHKLYYTAHELQRMIDGHRAEEHRKRDVRR